MQKQPVLKEYGLCRYGLNNHKLQVPRLVTSALSASIIYTTNFKSPKVTPQQDTQVAGSRVSCPALYCLDPGGGGGAPAGGGQLQQGRGRPGHSSITLFLAF